MMDARTDIGGMVRASGKTPGELSYAMGKSRTYAYGLLNHESVPRLDTFVRLAHACGYRIMLQDAHTGDSIELYADEDNRTKRVRSA